MTSATKGVKLSVPHWRAAVFTPMMLCTILPGLVQAQERPIFVSGADVPPAYEAGDWKATAQRMTETFKAYRNANWDYKKVPAPMWQHPDQKYAENKNARSKQVSGYVIPADSVYNEVAFWCETYYRQNMKVYRNRTECDPKGFFLVMYKDGKLDKVQAKDVRLIPHPSTPNSMIPVFPRMKRYHADLPMLPSFSNIRS